jgi:effector-binding domain-containing protein
LQNLLPIGRFSAICHLTIPALRLYDELNLLRPAIVDSDTGYRYYSLAQVPDAERIRQLREVEMPLDEIRALLAERDPVHVHERLENHRARLLERAEQYRQCLASLDRLIEQEKSPMQYEVKLRDTVAQPMVSIRGHSSTANMPDFFGRAYAEIFGVLGPLGVRPNGTPVTIYHDPEINVDDVDLEVVVPVAEPVQGAGRVKGGTLPGGPVAYTLHVGPYENIHEAYKALAEWVQQNGREMAGPPRESYLVDPRQVKSPSELRTEVMWPIR